MSETHSSLVQEEKIEQQNEQIKKESLVAKYLNYLVENTDKKGNYIYRGQANASWELKSSAQRRLDDTKNRKKDSTKKKYNHQDFILYHKHIIENARKLGYDQIDIQMAKLTDLEMLAEIQHHGGATCLTDFTTNYLVALWFAAKGNNGTGKEIKDSDGNQILDIYNNPVIDQHGKIFALNLSHNDNKNKIYPVKDGDKGKNDTISSLLEKKIQYNGHNKTIEPRFWLWKPTRLNNRIAQQDSIFMFGLGKFKDNLNCIPIFIPQSDKEDLLEELETYFDFSVESVFDDLPGFSFEANNAEKPISRKIFDNKNCMEKAFNAYKQGEYETSIRYLDQSLKCITKNSCNNTCQNNIVNIYLERGKSYFQQDNKSLKALNDFKKVKDFAIETNDLLSACSLSLIILYKLKNYKAAFEFCLEIINAPTKYDIKDFREFYFSALELSLILNDIEKFQKIDNHFQDNTTLRENNGELLYHYFKTLTEENPKLTEFSGKLDSIIQDNKNMIFDLEIKWVFDDIENWIKEKNDYEKLLITQKYIEIQDEFLNREIDKLINTK